MSGRRENGLWIECYAFPHVRQCENDRPPVNTPNITLYKPLLRKTHRKVSSFILAFRRAEQLYSQET